MNKRIKTSAAYIMILVIVALGVGFAAGYFTAKHIHGDKSSVITHGDLNIHFLEIGSNAVGDSVFVDCGDTEMLIDSGSQSLAASHIKEYIDKFVEDGKLEYVIATHAHEDHIAGFAGGGAHESLLTAFEIGTIIEYAQSEATSSVRERYEEKRDAAVANGAVCYTALQCYNEDDGAKKTYTLGDGISLEILYHDYYEESGDGNENLYSVCAMIRNGEQQYLFTGDLEEEGEDALVNFYKDKGGLGHCELYKGGHHGSNTSSNEVLLEEITPDYVCVCTCAGAEYDFPKQGFINRISEYTDKVYLTSMTSDNADGYTQMNGNIVFAVTDREITVTGTFQTVKLKDTDWFKSNRETPAKWE